MRSQFVKLIIRGKRIQNLQQTKFWLRIDFIIKASVTHTHSLTLYGIYETLREWTKFWPFIFSWNVTSIYMWFYKMTLNIKCGISIFPYKNYKILYILNYNLLYNLPRFFLYIDDITFIFINILFYFTIITKLKKKRDLFRTLSFLCRCVTRKWKDFILNTHNAPLIAIFIFRQEKMYHMCILRLSPRFFDEMQTFI